jgi:anthranilate phosphoribosyltransferase
MRHAGPVRAELGIPTVFNFIGPLSTRPASTVRSSG